MKKKIVALLAIVAVFGLAIAAYAYAQTTAVTAVKATCCKDHSSCPMKGKHEGSEHAGKSCCGDSCPMKKGEAAASMVSVRDAASDCCDCCGDSCPMKKGETTATKVSTSDNGKDCCSDCDCCKGKHDMTA